MLQRKKNRITKEFQGLTEPSSPSVRFLGLEPVTILQRLL